MQQKSFDPDFKGMLRIGFSGIVNLMQKIARLCSKERTICGFVLSRTPVFSPLTPPQIFSRERRLGAIFNKLTMPFQVTAANVQPYYLALLAEAYGTIGESAAGLGVLAEALVAVDKTGARVWEAEPHRLKGELLLQHATGGSDEAEARFQQALDIARRQQAKSRELRAAMSLSRLWQQQGKPTPAYELLAPVYGWFTEGFDTADLKEAKALLEELRG